eukprot:sb/3477849/
MSGDEPSEGGAPLRVVHSSEAGAPLKVLRVLRASSRNKNMGRDDGRVVGNRNMGSSGRNSGKTHLSNFGINAGEGSSNHGNNLGVGNQGNSESASHTSKHGSHVP